MPIEGDEGKDEAHRELGLMDGLRIGHRPQNVKSSLVNVGADVRNLVGGELVVLHRL